jgi:hypothetical protein
MKSEMKPQMNEFVQAIGELAAAQQQLARQAEQQYSLEVNSILRDQCCEPQRIGVSGSNTLLQNRLYAGPAHRQEACHRLAKRHRGTSI